MGRPFRIPNGRRSSGPTSSATDGSRSAQSAAGQVEKWIADYAFGSGHHATTFVTVLDLSIPKDS